MAEEDKRLRGYDHKGNPLYHTDLDYKESREKMLEHLMHDLDFVAGFPNEKSYVMYGEDEYFEIGEDEEPIMTHLVKVDEQGNIISKRPFDVIRG